MDDDIYRMLILVTFWLGMVAFGLAVVMLVLNQRFLFFLLPGGLLRGAQTLFLAALGGYCAYRARRRA